MVRPIPIFLPLIPFSSCDAGGCELDNTYTGLQLPKDATTGKYTITVDFIREMMKLFKDGKALPKRYVWEIALGAYSVFEKEPSLVDLTLENGKSIDVIGDVHGVFGFFFIRVLNLRPFSQGNISMFSSCSNLLVNRRRLMLC